MRGVRRLTALTMLAAAVTSGMWLDALGSQIGGCLDHVCRCASYCPSKASCHETGEQLPTSVRPACSHSRGGELPAQLPAVLPFSAEPVRLIELGDAADAGPRFRPQADLRPVPRPPQQTPS